MTTPKIVFEDLKDYFTINRVRGASYINSFFRLFKIMFRRVVCGEREDLLGGNILSGYHLYQKPLLISYSRSGTNWIRYILEYLSLHPTPGYQRLVKGRDYFIDRAHAGFVNLHKYQSVILLIRNYKECLVRHHGVSFVKSFDNVSDYLGDQSRCQKPIWYIRNIESFDQFTGKKMVVYYELLVSDSENQIGRLAEFLGLKNNRLTDLIENIDAHKTCSISLYTKEHESCTVGNVDKLDYHSKRYLSMEDRLAFDQYYQLNYPEIFEKYLKRYQEEI